MADPLKKFGAKIKLKNESKITLDVTENIDKRSAVAKLLNELL